MPTPEETIAANLSAPKSAKADGVEVTSQPLPDQMAAADWLASKAAARRTGSFGGITLKKLIPPGGG
jgi:hypothetical protein